MIRDFDEFCADIDRTMSDSAEPSPDGWGGLLEALAGTLAGQEQTRGGTVLLEESARPLRAGTFAPFALRSAGWSDVLIADYIARRSE